MDLSKVSQAFSSLQERNKSLLLNPKMKEDLLVNQTRLETTSVVVDSGSTDTNPAPKVNWADILKVVSTIGQFIPGVGQYIPLVTKVIAVVEEIQIPGHDKKQVAMDIIKTALSVYNTVGRANIDVDAVAKTLDPVIDLIISITNSIHQVQS